MNMQHLVVPGYNSQSDTSLGAEKMTRSDQAPDKGLVEVAVIGAGPYGLSLAAHLRHAGVKFRIFGPPMSMWRTRMPRGMNLKSEPFASTLYDPGNTFPISRYCEERGIPHDKIGLPVSNKLFCDYAEEFQKRFVPDLDTRLVTSVRQVTDGFEVELADGETARFQRVVVAVGISHYSHTPPEWAHISSKLLSHSSTENLGRFAGQRVAVIGSGASAVDCAIELASLGTDTHLLTRQPKLNFNLPPRKRTLRDKLRAPMSPVGPSWKGVLCSHLPLLFFMMPEKFRLEVTRRFLGPAPCWFTREPFERSVVLHPSIGTLTMRDDGDKVTVEMEGTGDDRTLSVDHVIAATGYRPDLRRLEFLDPSLLSRIKEVRQTPILTPRFESSVPGLFFIGVSASNTFGPMLRFAYGAEFAARRLSHHLVRASKRAQRVVTSA